MMLKPFSYLYGIDPDVVKFSRVAGITDATQKKALYHFVSALKIGGIWGKFLAIYPFVGGTATKHSYNLKNTAQFQITWSGSITHDSNGVTGDGSTGCGDTGLVMNSGVFINSLSFGTYLRTSPINTVMGSIETAGTLLLQLVPNFGGTQSIFDNTLTTRVLVSTISNTGLQSTSYLSGTNTGYQRGSSVGSSTASQGALPAFSMVICARNDNGTPDSFDVSNSALAYVSTGLTSSQMTAFNNAIQNFQTALGRQV